MEKIVQNKAGKTNHDRQQFQQNTCKFPLTRQLVQQITVSSIIEQEKYLESLRTQRMRIQTLSSRYQSLQEEQQRKDSQIKGNLFDKLEKKQQLQKTNDKLMIYERELDMLSNQNHKIISQNAQFKDQLATMMSNMQNQRNQFQKVIRESLFKQKQYRQEIIILNSRIQSYERIIRDKGAQFGQIHKKILDQCKFQRQIHGQTTIKHEQQIDQLRKKVNFQSTLIRQLQNKQKNMKGLQMHQRQKASVYSEINDKVFSISQQLNSLKLQNDQLRFRNRVFIQQKQNLEEQTRALKGRIDQLVRQSKLQRQQGQARMKTIDEQCQIIKAKDINLNQLCQSIRLLQFEEYLNQSVRTQQLKHAEKLYTLLSQY